MSNLFKLSDPLEIWIPVKSFNFVFSLKESMSLSDFQTFILCGIQEYNAGSEQLVEATGLAKSVIDQELHDMCTRKLLEINEDGIYRLSELSKHLLDYGNTVRQMNESKKMFLVDLVTGDISQNTDDQTADKPEGVAAFGKAAEYEISCIEPSDIKEVLINAFQFLAETDNCEDFLDSIVMEPVVSKAQKWKRMYLTHLPLGEYTPGENEQCISIRGLLWKRTYRKYNPFFEDNSNIMIKLCEINSFDDTLISERGKALIDEWNTYKAEKNITLYTDPITGTVDTSAPIETPVKKYAVDLIKFSQFSCQNELFEQSLAESGIGSNEVKVVSPDEPVYYYSCVPSIYLSETKEDPIE